LTRKRIYEIAKELGVSSKELIEKLEEMGMSGMKAANSVEEEEYALIVHLYEEDQKAPSEPQAEEPAEEDPAPVKTEPKAKAEKHEGVSRPPVVSVLGHIDHGKTTLLDAIRQSHLAGREAGGITQGIAAYQADLHGKRITFIDTPGHKAFTGMRARGAQATDIAILVVAADDGIMAQTVEAIDHIKAADVPMIVAINKIDKANADLNRVMNDLAQKGLMPEEWGGDTITVSISALQGEGIEALLEMILLVAEMEDLRADPKAALESVVIESHLSAGRGAEATTVIKNGTLKLRDWVVAGSAYGRVKALIDMVGERVDEASAGAAVTVLGLNDVPPVGTSVVVTKNQGAAKKLAKQNEQKERRPRREQMRDVMSVEDLFAPIEDVAELKLVLKAATTGALEAARREMEGLDVPGTKLDILHAGVGDVSESDVLLATTVVEDSIVVGFGVKADPKAVKLADSHGIMLLTYEIIYELADEVTRALKHRLAPEYREVQTGTIEVRDLFKIPAGVVAGCHVTDGKVMRRSNIRVMRNGEELFVGEIASLRRFDDDVREVLSGRECGIRINDFDDVQVGDQLIAFDLEEVER